MHFKLNMRAFATLWVLVLSDLAQTASGYVGPGAGGGGQTGLGWGGIIVMIIAGGLALCVLCGLVAVTIAATDRAKRWMAERRVNETKSGE